MKGARSVLIGLATLAVGAAVGVGAWLQSPPFGAHPDGARQARITASPNHAAADGGFRNLEDTPMLVGARDGRLAGFAKTCSTGRRARAPTRCRRPSRRT